MARVYLAGSGAVARGSSEEHREGTMEFIIELACPGFGQLSPARIGAGIQVALGRFGQRAGKKIGEREVGFSQLGVDTGLFAGIGAFGQLVADDVLEDRLRMRPVLRREIRGRRWLAGIGWVGWVGWLRLPRHAPAPFCRFGPHYTAICQRGGRRIPRRISDESATNREKMGKMKQGGRCWHATW